MKRSLSLATLVLAFAAGAAFLLLNERPVRPDQATNMPGGNRDSVERSGQPAARNVVAPQNDGIAEPSKSESTPPSGKQSPASTLAVDSGPGTATGHATRQAEVTESPVRQDFERFIAQDRNAYWADSAEALIADGINFSAFGSEFSDWSVECRQSMCLVAASTDAKSYGEQQRLPQGSWISMMRTVRRDISPVVPFASEGVSTMRYDPETNRLWLSSSGGYPNTDHPTTIPATGRQPGQPPGAFYRGAYLVRRCSREKPVATNVPGISYVAETDLSAAFCPTGSCCCYYLVAGASSKDGEYQ